MANPDAWAGGSGPKIRQNNIFVRRYGGSLVERTVFISTCPVSMFFFELNIFLSFRSDSGNKIWNNLPSFSID
jgi:hypothetical protein